MSVQASDRWLVEILDPPGLFMDEQGHLPIAKPGYHMMIRYLFKIKSPTKTELAFVMKGKVTESVVLKIVGTSTPFILSIKPVNGIFPFE